MTARLAHIRIFPVKALDPLSVSQALVLPSGALQHDRRFAFVNAEGRAINGKKTPLVHQVRSRFDCDPLRLVLDVAGGSHSFRLDADRPALEAWLSEFFSMPVRVVEDRELGFPDSPQAPGPSVISSATLETVASWFPGLSVEEARRRFRANLEIDGVEPFWEDRLYGREGQEVRFRIGRVFWAGIYPNPRCVVPTRDSFTGEVWPDFKEIFCRKREKTLPPWAERSRFDHYYRLAVKTRPAGEGGILRVGDAVAIV